MEGIGRAVYYIGERGGLIAPLHAKILASERRAGFLDFPFLALALLQVRLTAAAGGGAPKGLACQPTPPTAPASSGSGGSSSKPASAEVRPANNNNS